ncbi:pathogenicity island protein [Natronorubrum halophilum]|uniref:pathogenicity island protein n=1 Tax=Natronorubrum halophilum TaxID=1702106 RepID=UPI000EF64F5A|nr:pathogenicity island protein [Natronorubrum halophilum]
MSGQSEKETNRLKEMVYEYVEERQGVSFVELEGLLEDEIEIEGEQWIASTIDPKINFWVGLSEEFSDLIIDMLSDEELYVDPCQPIVYMVDGKVPDLDIVKQPPADGYKTERWLPVAFYTYDPEDGHER